MDAHPPRSPHARGFTLIELLVVISILALLISILLPALRSARFTAETIHCTARLRGLNLVHQLYSQDYRGAFVIHPTLLAGQVPGTDFTGWIPQILPYLSAPTDSTDFYDATRFPMLQCTGSASGTAIGSANRRGFVFGMINDLRWKYNTMPTQPHRHGLTSWRIHEIQDPSNKGLIMDNGRYAAVLHGVEVEQYGLRGHLAGFQFATPSHGGRGVSVSYIDGRAEFVASTHVVGSPVEPAPVKPDSPWRFKKFWVNPGRGYAVAPLN